MISVHSAEVSSMLNLHSTANLIAPPTSDPNDSPPSGDSLSYNISPPLSVYPSSSSSHQGPRRLPCLSMDDPGGVGLCAHRWQCKIENHL